MRALYVGCPVMRWSEIWTSTCVYVAEGAHTGYLDVERRERRLNKSDDFFFNERSDVGYEHVSHGCPPAQKAWPGIRSNLPCALCPSVQLRSGQASPPPPHHLSSSCLIPHRRSNTTSRYPASTTLRRHTLRTRSCRSTSNIPVGTIPFSSISTSSRMIPTRRRSSESPQIPQAQSQQCVACH